ncbi:HAMP domain-containing sensor histidine kinase [Leucobacter sp. UT-8R-CII-1-4]|uniref:sensor histidine kinase n=1 Tax=Leucobacter sp. UT-8R-CII-1-4 TaxID=3040075 RepID=UPI0024A7E287|nr:HAMP domain-containing sensor histidine kinase [Leucobacter sp. UT-8R-CII-1-4]MDI6023373.1 HAMP domain-containing sensor histidine kinase [Leucobacter sp. UT-8R-CII-1-4]
MAKALGGRPFRLTIRARLTLSFAALFALGGGLLVVGLNLFMRYGPVWSLSTTPAQVVAQTGQVIELPVDSTSPQPLNEISLLALPAAEIRDTTDVLVTLLWSSVIALICIVIIGSFAAWFLSGRLLSPLHTINEAARSATPEHLEQRVGLVGPRDELTDLSDTLDEMLERIERAFVAQRLFAANASHELRTPLATEKAMLDMLLDGPEPSGDEYREVAERVREVNARNIAMVNALLELSRAQALDPSIPATIETVESAELLREPLARCASAATARGLSVQLSHTPHTLQAQPQLLDQLLENLLQNAVRHGLPDGEIQINWVAEGGYSIMRISNSAEQLGDELRARLLEPFVRAEARVRGSGGSGLGLAISTAIAEAHGGTLQLGEGENGQFVVTVKLPRTATSI